MRSDGGVAGKRRQRELAGNARSGTYARFKARTKQRDFLRSNWRPFSAFIVLGCAVSAGIAWSMPNDFMAGAVVGAAVVALPGALWLLTSQMTGTTAMMMGAEAEQWTADELRRLTRRDWRLVNHVSLKREDIDHVLIGPGGAYAVETKWSNAWESSYGRQRIGDGIAQASANMQDLKRWHPFKSLGIAPKPVLVLWGPGLSKWGRAERIREIDGVIVVVGAALPEWAGGLTSEGLTADQVSMGWSALEAQVGRRDPLDSAMNSTPRSAAEWAARLGLIVGIAALGLLTFGQLVTWTHSATVTALIAGMAILPAVPLFRAPKWRWAARSWTIGIGLPTVALLTVEAFTLTR